LDHRLLRRLHNGEEGHTERGCRNGIDRRGVHDASGFSLPFFGVAGPTEPANAWICDTHIPGVPKFLSLTDLGPLVPPITCTFEGHADLEQLAESEVRALVTVVGLLRRL
jgi:hypothetical protein